jgi:hypothetical protein
MQTLNSLPLHYDPIMEAMLASRPKSFEDLSHSDELERQNRMTQMLRSSKKYKKIATESANRRWQSSIDQIDNNDLIFNNDETATSLTSEATSSTAASDTFSDTVKRHKRVTFADTIDIIHLDQNRAISVFDQVKIFFVSLKTRK